MKLTSLLLTGLATKGHAAVFDETEADYTVVVPAGQMHCYFQPMAKGLLGPVLTRFNVPECLAVASPPLIWWSDCGGPRLWFWNTKTISTIQELPLKSNIKFWKEEIWILIFK